MEPRIDYTAVSPRAVTALMGLERHVRASGIESALLELVKLRASQVNGCAYCIDMHAKDARAAGESEQRLYALTAWRETPFYTLRERAALAWADALTRIADGGVPEGLFDHARDHFTEAELVDLTLAVVAINGWNRLAISFRTPPGSYRPSRLRADALEG